MLTVRPLCLPPLSGVGNNLQDHLELYVQQQCTQPITLYKAQKPFHMVKIGLEWLTMFTGNQVTCTFITGQFPKCFIELARVSVLASLLDEDVSKLPFHSSKMLVHQKI